MNQQVPPLPQGLGALGEQLLRNVINPAAEFDFSSGGVWRAMVARMRMAPLKGGDANLFAAQKTLDLSDTEIIAAALACRVESEPSFAGAIAGMQATGSVGRLTFGLLSRALSLDPSDLIQLAGGRAVRSGLLTCGSEDLPLPGHSLCMAPPIVAALLSQSEIVGSPAQLEPLPIRFPPTEIEAFKELADWATKDTPRTVLLRGADGNELHAAASQIAESADCKAVHCSSEEPLPAAWLLLSKAVPVIALPASEDKQAPISRQLYPGPIILLAGPETHHAKIGELVREWQTRIPDPQEREELWLLCGLAPDTANRAAYRYRQGTGSISRIAARVREDTDHADLTAIAKQIGSGSDALDNLARRSATRDIEKNALVLPEKLSAQLDHLRQRILQREELADDLGPAIAARYRPGVRALMTGESGTGKTLAAHWLAARMGLPLYRADMAALTSKWIGETEKNLSQLLALAETTDCILFFDEADALFGARTDVSDSNDRHANAQTNFLLQRIEDFDGIAILSTNSRDRFDTAFVRRLDAILEFPLPDAAARARLWHAHLGPSTSLAAGTIDRLAQSVELAGGHIRNAVLGAALRAKIADKPIDILHINAALAEECDKLDLPLPVDIS